MYFRHTICYSIFMKKETDYITNLILEWQKTGKGFSDIMKEASLEVMDYPARRFHWEHDVCVDFYLFFYPRLLKLIKNFRYKGLSFQCLLRNTLAWQIKTYHRKKSCADKINQCVRYNCIMDAEASSAAAEPDKKTSEPLKLTAESERLLGINGAGEIRSAKLKRQLKMLALKNANYLDDAHIETLSVLTGSDSERFYETIMKLREQGEFRRERLDVFRTRINKAYIKLCQLQQEYTDCVNGTERNSLINRQAELKKRIGRAHSGKNRVQMSPTNSEIAEIMGLPKGSVDSGLYSVKRLLKSLDAQDDGAD